MKKYLFFLLPVFVFLFGFRSFASNTITTDQFDEFIFSQTGFHLSNNAKTAVSPYLSNFNDILLVQVTSNSISTYIGSFSGTNLNIFTGENCNFSRSNDFWNTGNFYSYNNQTISFSNFDHIFYSEYFSIDFEHPQYSVFVPKAKFAINYSVSPNSLNSQAYVPFNVSFYETSYYIQVSAVFHQPNNLLVSYDSNGLKYTALSSIDNTEVVVSPSDFLTYSDLNDTSSTGSTGFTRFTNLLKMSFSGVFLDSGNISFSYDGDYSQSLKDSAVSDYNSLRHVLTFGGSSVDLWVRYFTLDSDNNFVVGPWTIWKSYNPNSFSTYVPDYYQEYGKVSGTEYSTTDTNSPSDTTSPVVYNPVPTGGTASTTVNVTQNVPNYPDYPTIADYNKDNLLVNTINSITSLNGFFGDFGNFLTASFSFLPDFIWTIIGIGFSLSIIVMFLKIL